MLTQHELKKVIHYCPKTGVFTRLKHGKKIGHVNDKGYLLISVKNKRHRAHRLAWLYVTGQTPNNQIDHINMDRLDNRFVNLRECSNQENNCNGKKKSNNTSGFKGVHFNNQCKKWQARSRVDGKRIHIGLYETAEQAGNAYADFVKVHHGVFSNY